MNFIISVITIMIDQFSKKMARDKLSPDFSEKKLGGACSFRLVYNEGAFLGFLKNSKLVLNIVTWGVILFLLIFTFPLIFSRRFTLKGAAYSLILGGALSNAFDRTYRGKVTDFLAFYPRHKVHFNLADFGIFIGAILSIIFER